MAAAGGADLDLSEEDYVFPQRDPQSLNKKNQVQLHSLFSIGVLAASLPV